VFAAANGRVWSLRSPGKEQGALEKAGRGLGRGLEELLGVLQLDQACLLRSELDLVDLSQEPYHTAKERLDELQTELVDSVPRLYVLTRQLVPALTKLQMAVARAQAWVRTARVGLALETFRAKTGAYPDSLGALVPSLLPELPLDPFTGGGLLYRLEDKELLVYSVGDNGKDDGGLRETEKAGKKLNPGTDDIAWRVSR
jgi:hypothetical protein